MPEQKKPGGYRNLLVYQLAVVIFYLNRLFCQKYLLNSPQPVPVRRTVEQMVEAGRSGKQNIVEGSLEKSAKMNIRLTGVSRGSFGELLEDYLDFLLTREFSLWDKNDPRVLKIRANKTNLTNLSHWTNTSNLIRSPESFANLMVTLLSIENYLLDQMLRALEKKFIEEGGYTENLFKRRLEKRKLDK